MTKNIHILVCGGAGYIGSHMVKMLVANGFKVTVFDNLSTGHIEAVTEATFIKGDLLNPADLFDLFKDNNFEAVMHFSARSLVGESMVDPALYYRNNVVGSLNLLDVMRRHKVTKFIFSSSAAIFGNPVQDLINEQHPKAPINPYGETKLMVEQILNNYHSAYELRSVSLRYFNAAGADPLATIGESHNPESHLIPNVLRSLLSGKNKLKVFGDNYPTEDGTCVRDYIHINDLCTAHLKALAYLESNNGAYGINLGNSTGFSILEIIKAAEKVTGKTIPYTVAPPRAGDPARLVADAKLAGEALDWQPKHTDLEEIIATAWNWHQNPRY